MTKRRTKKTIDDIIAEVGRLNLADEARSKSPTKQETAELAQFLRGWSRGKVIVRIADDSTFWSCDRNMTKLTFKQAEALVAAGYATLSRDAKLQGAALSMRPK